VKKVKQLSVIERVTCSNRKRKLHAIIDIVSLDQALSEIWGMEVTHLETQLRKGRTHDTWCVCAKRERHIWANMNTFLNEDYPHSSNARSKDIIFMHGIFFLSFFTWSSRQSRGHARSILIVSMASNIERFKYRAEMCN